MQFGCLFALAVLNIIPACRRVNAGDRGEGWQHHGLVLSPGPPPTDHRQGTRSTHPPFQRCSAAVCICTAAFTIFCAPARFFDAQKPLAWLCNMSCNQASRQWLQARVMEWLASPCCQAQLTAVRCRAQLFHRCLQVQVTSRAAIDCDRPFSDS